MQAGFVAILNTTKILQVKAPSNFSEGKCYTQTKLREDATIHKSFSASEACASSSGRLCPIGLPNVQASVATGADSSHTAYPKKPKIICPAN